MKVINFSIIAHIDHGKSTLAQKLLELSSSNAKSVEGVDSMELEKERGITIKSKSLRLYYGDNDKYQLNMVDTPGHSDFSYEVSKALYACDYTFLLVDATSGVQAQTVSNAYKALDQEVDIIPVINKIDLPHANIEDAEKQLKSFLGFESKEIHKISAKTGEGVEDLIKTLIRKSEAEKSKTKNKERALIFDSFYDEYIGVVALVLSQGLFKKDDKVYLNSNNRTFNIGEVGFFAPDRNPVDSLTPHEIGYIVTGFKDLSMIKVGDTIIREGANTEPFPDFKDLNPSVFLGVYPENNDKAEELRKALEVLNLSDSSFTYEPESAGYLGYGFKCGFLGLLHADIILERIKREFDINVIITTPSVTYRIGLKDEEVEISSASDLPNRSKIDCIKEPFVKMNIVTPDEYIGAIMNMVVEQRRGELKDMVYSGGSSKKIVNLTFEIPLAEIIVDFSDELKSNTSGYASFEYEFLEYRKSDIVKLDILINKSKFPPLSSLVHANKAYDKGKEITKKLKEELPREQYSVPIQAAIGGNIIARETLKAHRKNVTEKLYGGDRTRKDKLLKRQKEGKKRMKKHGNVEISKDTFLNVLKKF